VPLRLFDICLFVQLCGARSFVCAANFIANFCSQGHVFGQLYDIFVYFSQTKSCSWSGRLVYQNIPFNANTPERERERERERGARNAEFALSGAR